MNKVLAIISSFIAGLSVAAAVAAMVYTFYIDPQGPRLTIEQPPIAAADPDIHAVRIELRKYVDANVDGNHVQLPMRTSLWGNHNDLFLKVTKRDGEVIATKAFSDTPIGNGLEWFFQPPIKRSEIYEIAIWDANTFSNELIDRVLINHSAEEGVSFHVKLIDTPMKHPLVVTPTKTGDDTAAAPDAEKGSS